MDQNVQDELKHLDKQKIQLLIDGFERLITSATSISITINKPNKE